MWNPFAFVGKLFGSKKSLDRIVKGVSEGLDHLSYTEEEKAGDAAKSRTEARQMIVEWMRTNNGSRLARRFIALLVASIWALEHLAATILKVISPWVEDPSKFIESANAIAQHSEQMNGAFILVLGYYFAGPYMGQMVQGAIKKLSGGIPSTIHEERDVKKVNSNESQE